MWMVGGTLVAVCTALPQLVLAFLAAGMSVTALAVGTALAGAVTQLGLVLALCLLRCNVTVDRGELLRKCALLLVACGVVALFVRDGTLSYTGTGLLMGLFVLFVMQSIAYQYRFAFREGLELITFQKEKGEKDPAGRPIRADRPVPGYEHPHQPAQPGRGGGRHGSALRGSVGPAEQRRGAGQPDWHHSGPVGGNPDFLWPLSAPAGGSVRPSPWLCLEAICGKMPHLPAAGTAHAGAEQRHFEHHAGALPASSLMYRRRLPVGEQFRQYDIPFCVLMALIRCCRRWSKSGFTAGRAGYA